MDLSMFRSPGPLLILLAVVVAAVLNAGGFATLDTRYRLQAERWIRLGEPPVRPQDVAAGFGLRGRNGVVYPWYGVGQSLVLWPFDALADATIAPLARHFRFDAEKQQQIVELSIAFLMQAVLTAALLLLARELLASFGFAPAIALAGALSLLFGTTCLEYVQCAQENELLLVLALASLTAMRRWQQGAALWWAALAGIASGFAIVVRLPSVLEAAVFGAFALWCGGRHRRRFLPAYLPGIAAGVFVDRWYQWLRFGEWSSTYMDILGRQTRPAGAPLSYPFSYPFAKGFLGAFFSADKSIFLFDPLLLVLGAIAIWRWRSLARPVRNVLCSLTVLLLLYAAAYARYYDFGGDAAWADRFLTLPVQLLALFAVPVLLSTGRTLPRLTARTAWTVVVLAIALQILSTTLSSNIEVAQRDFFHSHSPVLVNRVENFAAIVEGRPLDPRFVDIPDVYRTYAYLPFQLSLRYPNLARPAIAVWWCLVLLTLFLPLYALRQLGGRRAILT